MVIYNIINLISYFIVGKYIFWTKQFVHIFLQAMAR